MTKHRYPLLLLVLLAYIMAPQLWTWMSDTNGGWYRPFIVWMVVIVIAYMIQGRKHSS